MMGAPTLLNLVVILEVEDQIFAWLAKNYPTVTTVVVIVMLSCWFTWWIRGRIIHYRSRLEKTESDCCVISKEHIPGLYGQLTGIDSKLSALIVALVATKKIDPALFITKSPRELTDLGIKILTDSGGKKFIDDRADTFVGGLEKQNFTSGLDVENHISVMMTEMFYNDDSLKPVKDFLFQHPSYRVDDKTNLPLDITVMVLIMGLYLRNKYFEKHPDLKKDL